MGVFRILISVIVFSKCCLEAKSQSKDVDTIANQSYDNFKVNSGYSSPYVVIKSKQSGKILYENTALNGKCPTCYEDLVSKADSAYKAKNYADAAMLFNAAFMLNDNKGKVKHRMSAACCFTQLNDFDNAFDHLNRVVFGAKFLNLEEFLSNNCYKPLHKDPRWMKLIDGINSNLEGVEQRIKMDPTFEQ
jgi:hypothetical protein